MELALWSRMIDALARQASTSSTKTVCTVATRVGLLPAVAALLHLQTPQADEEALDCFQSICSLGWRDGPDEPSASPSLNAARLGL